MRQFWLSASVVWYLLLLFFWYDFLNSGCLLSLAAILPIKTYSNAKAEKTKILKENKNKSGIYKWKNLKNDKCYIGSAEDLSNRLSFYYSCKALKNSFKNSQSYIYNALLKHGHSNFEPTILEYCDKKKCLERERYYQQTLNPEYNIAKEPGAPMSGRKHSDETKQNIIWC